MLYTVSKKLGFKVDRFHKTVWKISILENQYVLFSKYETFLPAVSNYMP